MQHVQSALRLSAHILAQDKMQLASQLLGRLLPSKFGIQALLEGAIKWNGAPWLRPLTPSLMQPGRPLLRTFTGHRSGITAVAMTPDGQRALSGSEDGTLKVWNLVNGVELSTLTVHSGSITVVAITSDGQRAFSASLDGTLRVWELGNGMEMFSLDDSPGRINTAAMTSDGQYALSVTSDGSLTK